MILPSPRTRRKNRIEVIPLIDIVFFLLATFMMVSVSMVKNKGVSVNLPHASTSTRQSEGDKYTSISITKNGEIYFDKVRVNKLELEASLKKLKAREADPTIFLNGDDSTSLGKAVEVLDQVRKL